MYRMFLVARVIIYYIYSNINCIPKTVRKSILNAKFNESTYVPRGHWEINSTFGDRGEGGGKGKTSYNEMGRPVFFFPSRMPTRH